MVFGSLGSDQRAVVYARVCHAAHPGGARADHPPHLRIRALKLGALQQPPSHVVPSWSVLSTLSDGQENFRSGPRYYTEKTSV